MGTTANRGYTYPASSDHTRIWEHIQNLADDVDTDVAALITSLGTPQKTTGSGVATAATNFSVTSATARTLAGGKDVYVNLVITTTNALTASGGNISDTTICTVQTAFRPTEAVGTIFSANAGTGEVRLNTDGTVVLRTLDVNISGGGSMSMTFKFIKD